MPSRAGRIAAITAEATIWGLGEDQCGPRMSRAVALLKRVADPKDPCSYSHARWKINREK